jgi:hypothetical protein
MERLMKLLKEPPDDLHAKRREAIDSLNSKLKELNPENPHFMSAAVVNELHVKGHAWCGHDGTQVRDHCMFCFATGGVTSCMAHA